MSSTGAGIRLNVGSAKSPSSFPPPPATLERAMATLTAAKPAPSRHVPALQLIGNAAAILVLLLVTACNSGGGPTSSRSPAPTTSTPPIQITATPPPIIFQTAANLFGVQIPVPSGWTLSGAQDVVSLQPAGGGADGFVLTFMSYPPATALSGNCAGGAPPEHAGPVTVAGHAGPYETYCPSQISGQGAWTVRLPTADGTGSWVWDYLGATGLESGPDAETFEAVLQAFAAPDVPQKPTQSPTPTS